jgi:hypothetical protein
MGDERISYFHSHNLDIIRVRMRARCTKEGSNQCAGWLDVRPPSGTEATRKLLHILDNSAYIHKAAQKPPIIHCNSGGRF